MLVLAETIVVEPAAFDAFASVVRYFPLSAFTILYVADDAFAIAAHFALLGIVEPGFTALLQRYHCKLNVGLPAHEPGEAEINFPTFALPESAGATEFVGTPLTGEPGASGALMTGC